MAFIKFLFYFFLTIFILRLVFRLLLPVLLRYLVKKHAGGGAFTWSNIPQEPKQPEGKVTIKTQAAQKEKIVDKGEGDYVSYEEVK